MRAQAKSQSPEAGREVAKQFEALFLQMMLKSMREAGAGLTQDSGDSEQTRFYQEMFDKQIAIDLAGRQGIGLASILERQLGGDAPATPASGEAHAVSASAQQSAAAPPVRDWRPADADARSFSLLFA